MNELRSPQFGAVLFRASELISIQGAEVFDRLGISLHANKISIVLALNAKGPLSSTELSRHIGVSRQLIESRLKPSVKDGFFVPLPDPNDARKQIYDISDNSREEANRILLVMKDFEKVYAALWKEIEIELEESIKLMERALARKSLIYRLCDEFPSYYDEIDED